MSTTPITRLHGILDGILFARGDRAANILGLTSRQIAKRSPEANKAASGLRVYREKPVTKAVESVSRGIRKEKLRRYDGMAWRAHNGEVEVFKKGDRSIKQALDNLDRQAARHGKDAFTVSRSMNNAPLVTETRRLPQYHLV